MANCDHCGKKLTEMPHRCKYCGEKHCSDCLQPENHNCQGIKNIKKDFFSKHTKEIIKKEPTVINMPAKKKTVKKKAVTKKPTKKKSSKKTTPKKEEVKPKIKEEKPIEPTIPNDSLMPGIIKFTLALIVISAIVIRLTIYPDILDFLNKENNESILNETIPENITITKEVQEPEIELISIENVLPNVNLLNKEINITGYLSKIEQAKGVYSYYIEDDLGHLVKVLFIAGHTDKFTIDKTSPIYVVTGVYKRDLLTDEIMFNVKDIKLK